MGWVLFGRIDRTGNTARLQRIESLLTRLLERVYQMANDFTHLQDVLSALEAKAAETNATLAGLAQAVVDLRNTLPADVQPQIDALAAQAQSILDGLTTAEDAADDQLPPA